MARLAPRRVLPTLQSLAGVRAVCQSQHSILPRTLSTHSPLGGEPLYPTHIPTNPLQRTLLTFGAAAGALMSPARADLVATLGETTGYFALNRMRDGMLNDEVGRQILDERPRIVHSTVAHCWELPPNTFGGAYAKFMGDRGFSADDRPPVRFVDDPELAYVAARAREVHDFWHVLFDLNTSVLGEAALKAVEFAHTGMPMCALATLAGAVRLQGRRRELLQSVYLPWGVQAGLRCAPLLCLRYEDHFHEDLQELRARWRIQVAPAMPGGMFENKTGAKA
uniref:Ubiquinone biosynthesis protein COQ4 homolog, mitochondrial n=1 Tax=Pyramimonas obovata TaxID=1411642 RepID=A0A7S0R0H5_9CHLO|mmetsp:Transcript_21573/g.47349  ORF Transcript_21573/g.47349 Transcript_21573/m.47349 type:complete len:280 (+) Transcript_21573:301-1140(+)